MAALSLLIKKAIMMVYKPLVCEIITLNNQNGSQMVMQGLVLCRPTANVPTIEIIARILSVEHFLLGRHKTGSCKLTNFMGNNISQVVAWESFFFNDAVSWSIKRDSWLVLISRWLIAVCSFNVSQTLPKLTNSVGFTPWSRRLYGVKATALRLNRIGLTP